MNKPLKNTLLILFICVSACTSWAQDLVQGQYALSVEQTTKKNKTQEFFFKPNKNLKILTKTGEVLITSDYSFLKDGIVVNAKKTTVIEKNYRYPKFKSSMVFDTISLAEIDWIKGRVSEDEVRKTLGVLLMTVGTASLYIPVMATILSGSVIAAIVLTMPIAPIIIVGYKIVIGTRKFKTSKGWDIKIE